MTDDEELQARIGEVIDIDSLIALGAEHGCEFNAEDLAESTELSDEELEGVAGGVQAAREPFKGEVKFRIGGKPRDEFLDDEDSMSSGSLGSIRTGGMQEKEMDG